ncbi:MAG: methionyl-tRNA formyltransferase [Candidatus Paceibacterota bacterium]|jgi:methionyl-tRNA formyltransferase
MNKLNFVFWGTPDVASETLEILKQNGFTPSLIVTSPDKPQGRKMIVTPPPVKTWAIENKIPYIQPESILDDKQIGDVLRTLGRSDGDGQRKFSAENFRGEQNISDLFIVVAYGKIIPEKIINMPKLGSINIHYSLLPKYRGASPVESAILNGDTETGISIQKMAFKIDRGQIIAQENVPILPHEKAPDLRKRLIKLGAELLVKTLPEFTAGKIKTTPQDEQKATYCKKIKKEDGLIDLNSDAITNYNKFRAYASWPRTFFFRNDKRIIITDAELIDNPLDGARSKQFIIKKVIPENGKETDWKN